MGWQQRRWLIRKRVFCLGVGSILGVVNSFSQIIPIIMEEEARVTSKKYDDVLVWSSEKTVSHEFSKDWKKVVYNGSIGGLFIKFK